MKRTALIVLAAPVAASLDAARPDSARPQGGDNPAIAINRTDRASIFRFAFKIRRTMSDVVDETNAAVAFASCEECQTVALAVQVILIFSDPDVVTPTNLALALNYQCTACETLAAAYQFVFTTGGPVHFTAEGNRRIAELRRALRELLKSDLPIAELQPQIDALMDEFREILRTELVAAGKAGEAPRGGGGGTETTPTETEPPTTEPATTTQPAETTETAPTETTTTETTTEATTTTETTPAETTETTTAP